MLIMLGGTEAWVFEEDSKHSEDFFWLSRWQRLAYWKQGEEDHELDSWCTC